MRKVIQTLQVLVMVLAAYPGVGFAQAPKDGVYISDEDVRIVLKRALDTKRTSPDNTIRVIDMDTYQLGVAVVHRGAMKGGRGANANAGGGGANSGGTVVSPSSACGEHRPGAVGPTGISHDDTAESYVVISGSATLITGGTIVNGKRSAPDNEVTTILNGPSCSGTMVEYTSREIKTGDIIIIPEGVPHGFSDIPDQVTYLSIRPDLKKVLQHGYVNPALKTRD
jgi:mannose-6-phosphate isomerase-like protein (cupin superfamily)